MDSFSVYSFDPETGHARPTGLAACEGKKHGGSIINMHIDNNEVLTVASMGESDGESRTPVCIYRYPTK
jgi:hypothetical protein